MVLGKVMGSTVAVLGILVMTMCMNEKSFIIDMLISTEVEYVPIPACRFVVISRAMIKDDPDVGGRGLQ